MGALSAAGAKATVQGMLGVIEIYIAYGWVLRERGIDEGMDQSCQS
jgi:hypothetical protein